MNIVFWALVVLCAAALWFALSSQFWDVGEMFSKVFQNAKDAMSEEETEDEENE